MVCDMATQSSPSPALVEGCREMKIALKLGLASVLGAVVADMTSTRVRQEVTKHVDRMLPKHKKLFDTLTDPALPPQPAYQVLLLSASVRIHHLARQLPPSISRNLSTEFDRKVLGCFKALLGREGEMFTHQQLPITTASDSGFGMRSVDDLAPPRLRRSTG